MKKFISFIAYTVVVLFVLSTFGWIVKHSVKGSKDFGSFGKGLVDFVSFFDLFEQSVEEVAELPKTFVKTNPNFAPVNRLEQDLWILTSYSNEDGNRNIDLINLRNNEVAHQWEMDEINRPANRVMHSLMLPDSSLVYSVNNVSGLYCIDKNGVELWEQPALQHHHSMNLNFEGNIWACTNDLEPNGKMAFTGFLAVDGRHLPFLDNSIALFNSKTGDILFHKSLTDLIVENELEYLLLKTGKAEDPIHLNDVEPALADGPYWKQDDVFLSMRHTSAIIHYRPSTDSIINVFEGPFLAQHDVDILNDSTLGIFNNNAHQAWQKPSGMHPKSDSIAEVARIYSNLVEYHFESDSYEVKYKDLFAENDIYTFTEGLADYHSDGRIFIEEQNSGLLWVIRNDTVLYKGVLSSQHEGYHHLANWARLME